MKLSPKLSLLAPLALVLLLCQVDARPSRASRRNKAKAKRTWTESAVVDNEIGNKDILFPSIGIEPESMTDLTEGELKVPAEATPKALPNKWLELERTLPAVINAPLSSDLTLECVAVGSPPPRVFWLKDGKRIDHLSPFDADKLANHVFDWHHETKRRGHGFSMANVKSKLPLRCLRPEDQGEYTCMAENDGRQLVATSAVTIEDNFSSEMRPECLLQYTKKGKKIQPAYIMSYEYLHMETIGSDVILICHAVGRPRPQVSWFDFEGKSISIGKKFKVTESGNLVIRNLSWTEMGEYTCRAENDFGSDSASTFLYPLLGESSS